ncbi:hypothetical protein OG21DRAFT_1486758 [Imleria badia]|nr:hypothetical protein OG21DRAFT_1486758 [Imleria badia]
MHFRLLGYLIREAIYDESRDGICREINSCEGDKDRLHKLADLYFRLFVRIFRSSRNSAPSPSPHPSRASFNTDRESLEPDLRSTARHANRTRTLQRDNNRCIVTGALSLDSLQPSETPLLWGVLQVAHILPRSMNDRVATSEESRNQAAEVWTIFWRFGKIAPEELNGDGINRLENLMTLWDTIHALFDKLCVDDDPYKCFVKMAQPNGLIQLPESFMLTTTDPSLPRPSPQYLRLHAACARVANLSGAAEYADSFYGDSGDKGIGVLADDGSATMDLPLPIPAAGIPASFASHARQMMPFDQRIPTLHDFGSAPHNTFSLLSSLPDLKLVASSGRSTHLTDARSRGIELLQVGVGGTDVAASAAVPSLTPFDVLSRPFV